MVGYSGGMFVDVNAILAATQAIANENQSSQKDSNIRETLGTQNNVGYGAGGNNDRGNVPYSTPSTTSSYSSPPPPAPTPPSPWITTGEYSAPTGIKQAEPDIILDRSVDTSGDYIVERFFEQLGGTELINISRHDLIDGIDVVYNPIANLSSLRRRFNPNNIIAIDYLAESEFSRTSIDLISRGINEPYFDDDGNLVVEIDIMKKEENIEVEISQSGTVSRIEL